MRFRKLRILPSLAAVALVLATAPPALAATAGIDSGLLAGSGGDFPGNADFGSGTHISGIPSGGYTVTWDYTPVNGVVVVTARVAGTLYFDRLGGGCARLLINFQDLSFNNLFATQTTQFCGPGFDANNAANKRGINVASPADSRIRHVQLVIGSGATAGQILNDRTTTETFPGVTATETINSGTADLGGPGPVLHLFGAPVNPYHASLALQTNGTVRGDVNGILFWDSTGPGTACALIDFMDSSGVLLTPTRTVSVSGQKGGNATLASNQRSFDSFFSNASLFKIRLRVGTGAGPGLAPCTALAGVTTKNYALGPAVGVGRGVPFAAAVSPHDDVAYGVEWVVPDPDNWHSLDSLELRLVDDDSEILRVKWDEATNAVSEFDPRTGRFGGPAGIGSHVRFEHPEVALLLRNTEIIGSGPTGPSVLLNIGLQFKPKSSGHTFTVEVRATDDFGNVQGWDLIGAITVR